MSNRISKKYKNFSVTIDKDRNHLNPKSLLYVENTLDPQEIVDKLNDAVQYYGYLGQIKADMENKLLDLNDRFKFWLETNKSKHDEKSEGALERQVIINEPKKYKYFKNEIRATKHILRCADVTRKTFKIGIEVLRSLRKNVEEESDITREYDIKEKKRKTKKQGTLGDF